jgi:hypothetical protein
LTFVCIDSLQSSSLVSFLLVRLRGLSALTRLLYLRLLQKTGAAASYHAMLISHTAAKLSRSKNLSQENVAGVPGTASIVPMFAVSPSLLAEGDSG